MQAILLPILSSHAISKFRFVSMRCDLLSPQFCKSFEKARKLLRNGSPDAVDSIEEPANKFTV
jgi:hypothetical protein